MRNMDWIYRNIPGAKVERRTHQSLNVPEQPGQTVYQTLIDLEVQVLPSLALTLALTKYPVLLCCCVSRRVYSFVNDTIARVMKCRNRVCAKFRFLFSRER